MLPLFWQHFCQAGELSSSPKMTQDINLGWLILSPDSQLFNNTEIQRIKSALKWDS